MLKPKMVGRDWLISQIGGMVEHITHIKPSVFNEEYRYLSSSVTSLEGHMRYDVNPYMREIVDCCDVNSLVREISLMKGVQITFTTGVLEAAALYFMAHIKTLPIMYVTADKDLASARIENNFLPMLLESGFSHIIRTSDEGNSRKTGKTANHLQFAGGGYLVPFGAQNANKMRTYSICILLKDELDAWPNFVGKNGDPDALTSNRCSAYWERRKIITGSTPLIKGSSKIYKAYIRGDQRKYMVLCKHCSYPQFLCWETKNRKTGVIGGFQWEMANDMLLLESVSYNCKNCGNAHYEADKENLFSEQHGAHWKPTSKPIEPNIRSYHLPAFYSPIGMQPWYKCVSEYLKGFDPIEKRVIDTGLYQVFCNEQKGEPFEIFGAKITFSAVSAHRRQIYKFGEIPNAYAEEYSGSVIQFLTCQVDVHKTNLAIAITGWSKKNICYLIDYFRVYTEKDEDDCSEISSPVWGKIRELIEEKKYIADDKKEYRIAYTLIDAGYANDTVTSFCAEYASSVYPILGRDRPSKNQRISEFAEFKTKLGTIGYRITVDHYKDRLAQVLRRDWMEVKGDQQAYHFNAPLDATDKQLKELTVETRRERRDDKGYVDYYWFRPAKVPNELWDLLVYGHAAVEILAYNICIQHFELDKIDWDQFWSYIEDKKLFFQDGSNG